MIPEFNDSRRCDARPGLHYCLQLPAAPGAPHELIARC
jgi:hypothetical protein